MHLHFPSIAVGVAAVSILLVSMSQATAPAGPPRIEYGPHPRDMVVIRAGTPFVVPPGKVFVLTAVGTTSSGGTGILRVDGSQEVVTGHPTGDGPSIFALPAGFTVPAGSTIDTTLTGSNSGRAWGYLANQ